MRNKCENVRSVTLMAHFRHSTYQSNFATTCRLSLIRVLVDCLLNC